MPQQEYSESRGAMVRASPCHDSDRESIPRPGKRFSFLGHTDRPLVVGLVILPTPLVKKGLESSDKKAQTLCPKVFAKS